MGKDFTSIGQALGVPARSAMLDALMDGSRRPASELAAIAGVRASTASEHLGILVRSGLVVAEARGRHRFFRLRDDQVAAALEALGQFAPDRPSRPHRRTREALELAAARLCYDHLAGRLGTRVTAGMREAGWLTDQHTLTLPGERGLDSLGIDVAGLRAARRPLTRACLDWTERRDHLAGSVGAAIAHVALDRGWVRRRRIGRGLVVTPTGRAAVRDLWGVANVDDALAAER